MQHCLAFIGLLVASVYGDINKELLAVKVPSQPNFQVELWAGFWYVQARLAPCSWAGSREFSNYVQDIVLEGQKIISVETWRNDLCVTSANRFVPSSPDSAGCFKCKDSIGNTWSGDMRVPATDYKTFTMSWGCTSYSILNPKHCDDPWISVKTRAKFPDPRTWKMIEAVLQKLWNLSLTDLDRISHDDPCIKDIPALVHQKAKRQLKLY